MKELLSENSRETAGTYPQIPSAVLIFCHPSLGLPKADTWLPIKRADIEADCTRGSF